MKNAMIKNYIYIIYISNYYFAYMLPSTGLVEMHKSVLYDNFKINVFFMIFLLLDNWHFIIKV